MLRLPDNLIPLLATRPTQLTRREPIPAEIRSLYIVPDDLVEIHDRLVNWGRWSRDTEPSAHCASLEHRYQPEGVTDEDDETGRRKPRIVVDMRDALVVFEEVGQLDLGARLLLHYWYVHKAQPGFIRRRLKLHGDRLVAALNSARELMARRCEVCEA